MLHQAFHTSVYTSDLETDILTEKNVSFANTQFPKTVIEVFHERIESVLGIIHKCSHPILHLGGGNKNGDLG